MLPCLCTWILHGLMGTKFRFGSILYLVGIVPGG